MELIELKPKIREGFGGIFSTKIMTKLAFNPKYKTAKR